MTNVIIVVEDKAEEQEAALEAIRNALGPFEEVSRTEIIPGCPMIALKSLDNEGGTQVQFASDLKSAMHKIEFATRIRSATTKAGVITDLMFPSGKEAREKPNGLGVIAECIRVGLPVVVCSDTDHHDVDWLRPVFPLLGKMHPAGGIPIILDKKDWTKAVAEIMRLLG